VGSRRRVFRRVSESQQKQPPAPASLQIALASKRNPFRSGRRCSARSSGLIRLEEIEETRVLPRGIKKNLACFLESSAIGTSEEEIGDDRGEETRVPLFRSII